MEIFQGDTKNFSTIIPKSIIDNLPRTVEELEIKVEKNHVNEKSKRRRGRPLKIKVKESIVYNSDRSRADGQWERKDESDVGDGVKVKAEYKPEYQDCDADEELHSEDLVIIKNEPIDHSFDNEAENMSHLSSDTRNRSTLNIKEEPLDIFHENVFPDLNNGEAKEFYVEQVNYENVKKEMQNKNELERPMKENFIKRESAIRRDNEENYSKNEKEQRHYCKHCEKSYKNKCHLSRHINYECLMSVRKKPKYKCSDCHIHFKTKYTMQRHFASKHSKEGERTSCNACRKTFRDQKTLNRHLSRCPNNGGPTNILTCKNCNKKYQHATSLWRHMRYECEKVLRFGCAHCDYMTLQKGNIVKHFRRKHVDEDEQTKYNCPKCKRIYKNEFTLKRHVNFECGKEPAFSCALCKFKTKRKFSLDMHIKHKH